MRDLDDPTHKVGVQAVLCSDSGAPEVLASGRADLKSETLVAVGVGDGTHAFHLAYSREVAEWERDRVIVLCSPGLTELQHAPNLRTDFYRFGADPTRFQGYVDECSTHSIAGWARNLDDASDKITIAIVLAGVDGQADRVLHHLRADQFSKTLVEIGVGDGVHAFRADFRPPLTPSERDRITARLVNTDTQLPFAPELRTAWHPIAHLAMDIVNNCNLRCPFCVVDYAQTRSTKFMSVSTFDAALRLIPYVTDGNFWLSCLHEATLHPKLLEFIARVPREYRHKLYYTTNLAKRMPEAYFAAICDAGLHHLNISVESLDPPIYEKMRAGARFPIFMENWDLLLAHHATGSAPPPLRYNLMCYRSNLASIPALVETLLTQKRAWQVELRHTYDVAHIPGDFRENEFMSTEEWQWLKDQLSHHDPSRVVLLMPPGGLGYNQANETPPPDPENDDGKFSPHLLEGEAAWNRAPRPLNLSMNWQGILRVYGWKPQGPGKPDKFITYAKTNIHFLEDPMAFLATL